ncbi:unnamed protein product [Gordionus sp. m RMFG-2023]
MSIAIKISKSPREKAEDFVLRKTRCAVRKRFFRQQQKEKDIDVALASKNQPSVELVFVVSSDDEERPDIPLPLHGKTNDELATKSSGKSSNDETPHRSQKDRHPEQFTNNIVGL